MPPVVLTIVVDDSKGTPQIRAFDKAISDASKTVQQSSQSTTQAAKSTQTYTDSTGRARDEMGRFVSTGKQGTEVTNAFSTSLTASAKAAIGLTAGFASVQGVVTILSAAATAATEFEAALNAIDALGTVSTAQLSKLREQLLALPPALGSSTELAKGLYDILGANVPAENAITVLTQSAELAKGGLGQLDTAINAVTKSAAAFGIPLEQAQFITDVFTQTVVRGQGRLEEFANAFPQVAATAAAAGASFIDTNAAMAVLTQTFKNADTAATGLNSFLQQLIQNSARLAAEGINVKEVLDQGGLAGLFERLNQVTGGSAERLKALINDSEGFRAALTLTGTQLGTFNETVQSYSNVTGLAHQAAQKNLSGATAAWTTFLNTLDRLVQEVAPPLLSAFTSVTGVLATLASDVTKLYRAFAESQTLQQLTADLRTFLGLLGETSVVQGFTATLQELNTTLLSTSSTTGQTYNAFETFDQLLRGNIVPTIEFVSAAWDLLNAAFNASVAAFLRFGQSAVQVVTPLAEIIAALDETATKLGLSDGRLQQLGESVKGVATDLSDAAAIFEEQAQSYVLGTTRMGEAQAKLQAQVGHTTGTVQQQAQTLPQQRQAAEGAKKATEQLTEAQQAANKALQEANVSVTAFQGALEKLKPGDILNAMPMKDLGNAVDIVTSSLEKMAASGKYSAREIQHAYSDAARILEERFGELPARFATSQQRFLETSRKNAHDILLVYERLGIETKEAQQRSAAAFTADVAALLTQTRQQTESTLALTKDAYGKQVIASRDAASSVQEAWQETGEAMTKATTLTVQDQIRLLHEMVDRINKGEFTQLPEDWDAVLAQLAPIAKRHGEGVLKVFRDVNGNIKASFAQTADAFGTRFDEVFTAVTAAEMKFGTHLRDHLSPALLKAAEDMGILGERTGEVENSTRGLTEQQKMLGYTVTQNGEIVNAYGNAIARLTEQTQRLMDLRINIETPFGSTIEVLQDQLRQANRDLLDLPSRMADLGTEGFRQQQQILLDLIAELEKRIADLQQHQASTTESLSGSGTSTGTGTGTSTGTTPGTGTAPGTAPTAPARPVTSPGNAFAPTSPILVQRPGVPTSGTGTLVTGGGSAPVQPGFSIIGTTVAPLDSATQRGVTVNVTLNAQMLTADRATMQQAVNTLAPAINEAIRRGAITP